MTLTARPVSDFLAAIRAPEPTPGGGSAAALAAAMGASLLAMVAALPKSRASNPDESSRLADAGARCTALSTGLAEQVERDSASYEAVMAAFKLPKGTDEEKAARSGRIQEATRGATEVPLEVMRACVAALRHAPEVAALGNPNAASDARVGVELLLSGLKGARFNVEINLGSLKDSAYVSRVAEESAQLAAEAERLAAQASRAVS